MKNMKNKYIGKNQKNEKNLIFFFFFIFLQSKFIQILFLLFL